MHARRLSALLALVAAVGVPRSGAAESRILQRVVVAGQPAPGGGVFERFSIEVLPVVAPVNSHGHVAFFATILRGRTSEGYFRATGRRIDTIAAQGDAAPGGGTFSGFGRHPIPALNEAGDVAFAAAVSGGKTVEGIFATTGRRLRAVAFAAVVEGRAVPGGVFVASASRIRMLVGAGDETPIGGIFAKFSERVALNGAGAVAFTAALKEAPIAQAVFVVEGGRPRKVVAIGDAAPGGGVFSHFGLWPALSAGGAVGFTASVDRGVAEVVAFVSTATDLARIAAVGDALPGGGTLSSFGLYPALALSPSGGATFATAPSASGGGVEGIFLVPPARAR